MTEYEEYPDTDKIYEEDRASDKKSFEKAKEFLKQKFESFNKPRKTRKIKSRKGKKIKLHLKPMPLPKNNLSFKTSVGQNINVGFSKPNVKISNFGGYGEMQFADPVKQSPQPVELKFAQQRIATRRAQQRYQMQLAKQRAIKQDMKVQQTFMTRKRVGGIQGSIRSFNPAGLNVVTSANRNTVVPTIKRIKPVVNTPRKNNIKNNFAVTIPKFNVPVLRKFKKRGAK